MLAPASPDLDFQLLFSALPTPHAVLNPAGEVLTLNSAALMLLGGEEAGIEVMGQPLRALHATLLAGGHALAPEESWTAALRAAQSGRPQVLTPIWQAPAPDCPEPTYWEATIRPVATGVYSGVIRYFLLRLLDVTTSVRAGNA